MLATIGLDSHRVHGGGLDLGRVIAHEGQSFKVGRSGLVALGRQAPSSVLWGDGDITESGVDSTVALRSSPALVFEMYGPLNQRIRIDRPLLFGRSPTCDVVVEHESVSRAHAVVLPGQGFVRVVDLGSQNGTRSGPSVVRDREFKSGVSLSFGSSQWSLRPAEGRKRLLMPSSGMRKVDCLIKAFSASDAPVVVVGETGVGKEALAAELHAESGRSGALIAINAATLSPALARSELFGHVAGSFTGAEQTRVGAFDLAHDGTLFLDEICDLPISVQTELLRALDSGEILPIGASSPHWVATRLVVASNLALEDGVRSGKLREDLYYRLNVLQIVVPPLRERKEDISVLARGFLAEHASGKHLSLPALEWLKEETWTGNIRELRTLMIRAALLSHHPVISEHDLARLKARECPRAKPERKHDEVIEAWNRNGRSAVATAKALGVHRATIHRHVQRYRKGPLC